MSENNSKRHPFRFLFKLALFVGALTAITRFVASKKDEYYGLTESEARAKFQAKLGPRIGEAKASEVADQVIPKLKEKGIIKADDLDSAIGDAKEATMNAANSGEQVGDVAPNDDRDEIGETSSN